MPRKVSDLEILIVVKELWDKEKKVNVNIKETHKSDKNIQIISFPDYIKPNSENISLNQKSTYLSQSETEEPIEK